MRVLLTMTFFSLIILSCGKTIEKADKETVRKKLYTFQGTPNLVKIKGDAREITLNWKEFTQFERAFDVMFQSSSNEDLELAINDLLDQEKIVRKSEYPTAFNSMKIKSRQKVLRTFLLKVKAGLIYNREVTEYLKQMLVSYNALRSQMNSIVNNELDTELILNQN